MTTTLVGASWVGGCNLLATAPAEAQATKTWTRTSELSLTDVRLTDDLGPMITTTRTWRFLDLDPVHGHDALHDLAMVITVHHGEVATDVDPEDDGFPHRVRAPHQVQLTVHGRADTLPALRVDCDDTVAVGLPERTAEGGLAYGDDPELWAGCIVTLDHDGRETPIFVEAFGDGRVHMGSAAGEILEVLD